VQPPAETKPKSDRLYIRAAILKASAHVREDVVDRLTKEIEAEIPKRQEPTQRARARKKVCE
jgi:hypothetical protein